MSVGRGGGAKYFFQGRNSHQVRLISEDFWVFLVRMSISAFSSLFSVIAVFFSPSEKYADNTAIADKPRKSLKSSPISKEKVNQALGSTHRHRYIECSSLPGSRVSTQCPESIRTQPLSEYGFAYGLTSETCQFSKIVLVSPTVKERKRILSEYRLTTVLIVSKYGLDWSAVRFGLVPSTVSLSS